MRILYETSGRAREYGLIGCNPWGKSWCSHDCSYCYVPGTFHMSREQWRAQGFHPRKDLIEMLRKDCDELRGTDKRVLCCFAGDLYTPEAVESGIGRLILETFREFDVPFQVLTKGGTDAAVDFDIYGPHDAFATTMTCTNDADSEAYEPGAALPEDRVEAICEAQQRGIETWVSLEPVLSPHDALYWIERLYAVVDLFKIGVLNHDKERASRIDWRAFGIAAIELCETNGNRYYIKQDLAKYLAGVPFVQTDTRKVAT